jgi:hypothetical protein
MKKIFFIIQTIFLFGSAATGTRRRISNAISNRELFYITNATIHVGNGTVINNGTIKITDGKIVQVGTNIASFG